MRAIYLTSDLLFSSRVSSLASERGHQVEVCRDITEAAGKLAGCDLAILDLSQAGLDAAAVVKSLRQAEPNIRVIAYGPHVAEELLAAAQAAGCDQVLPRSQFDRQIAQIFRIGDPRHEV